MNNVDLKPVDTGVSFLLNLAQMITGSLIESQINNLKIKSKTVLQLYNPVYVNVTSHVGTSIINEVERK